MTITSAIFVTALQRGKPLDSTIGPELVIECTINWQDVETYVSHWWEHDGITLSEKTQLASGISSSRYSLSADGFTLTARNLVQSDEGQYVCRINYIEGEKPGDFNARAVANVLITQYLPPVDYPECSLTPTSPFMVGDATLFSCFVDLTSTNVQIMTRLTLVRSDGSSIYLSDTSGFTRLLTAEDNFAEFICTMTSPTFPTASRTCSVGPIIVASPGQPIPVTVPPVPPFRTTATSVTSKTTSSIPQTSLSTNQRLINSTKTASPLQSGDNHLWIIVGAAVGALLIILFLLIALVCWRRRRKSNPDQETQTLHQQRPSTDSIDIGDAIEMRRNAPVDNLYGVPPVPTASYGNDIDEAYSSDDDYPTKPPIREPRMININAAAGASDW